MSYVLSYIRPDRTAVVLNPVPYAARAAKTQAPFILAHCADVPREAAREFGYHLSQATLTAELTHDPSGYIFRIDPADNPPNVCPCCGALVRPGDHAFAGHEDAYCLGCFTWDESTQHSPANTAHAEKN